MSIKTPEELAQQVLDELDLGGDLGEGVPKTAHDLTHAVQSGWIEGDTVITMIVSAIQADRQQRKRPLVLLVEGEVVEGTDVDVLDLGFTSYRYYDEHEQDDIDTMLESLRDGGFESQAERLERWWDER